MHSANPLPKHPELTVLHSKAWSEYRVQNLHVRGKSNISVHTLLECFGTDALVCLGIALLWPICVEYRVFTVALATIIITYVCGRCTRVLWESVIILHSLGLQLETHRGLPLVPLFTSRRFIPLTTLRDFVINEGLRGWSVHYYLAVIQQSPNGDVTISVPFENIMPRFPVLLEIYHGVHELLFDNSSVTNVIK
ncbi:hypothetical protein DAEQUDRAFT_343932 [Daedalea quercina L-15889]|uniref:Phosphatidylinositol N-acetylglucosaminyltransferase subunit H conserved domain-containing protein n=1 Tax=Daedalea quercina L-15889 TaxID=1314783 RepID=A0A165PGL0_9APHY|nr:hypothetical protein DAEQUDRAFT_343932 [Daedalea quercina L-15889]